MNEWAINIFDSLEKIGIATPIVVMLLAALPIAEARIALPLGIKYGMSTAAATFYSFLGSSAAALLLCACFLPIMNKLSQSKIFGKLSQRILNIFKIKSQKINYDKAAFVFVRFRCRSVAAHGSMDRKRHCVRSRTQLYPLGSLRHCRQFNCLHNNSVHIYTAERIY